MFKKIIELYNSKIPTEIQHNFNCNVLMCLFYGLFSGCYSNFYGVIAREYFNAGAFWIGLVNASINITAALGFIVAGWASKGKEHIWCKYLRFLCSFVIILSAFIPNTMGKLFCIILFFFHMSACYGPLENTVYGYIYPLNLRTTMLGNTKMVQCLFTMVFTLVVGLVINSTYFGIDMWRVVFVAGGIFMFISGIFMGKMNPIPTGQTSENPLAYIKKSLKLVIEDKFNFIIIISGIFYIIGLSTFNTLYPMYQVDVLHLNGKEVSILAVVLSVGNIILYPIMGSFLGKMNPVKGWLWSIILMVIYPLFYVFTKGFYPLIIGVVFWSVYAAISDICWVALIIFLGGKEKIKEYEGLYGFIVGLRQVIGLFISSWIIEGSLKITGNMVLNYKIAFLIGILFTIISFLTFLPMFKDRQLKDLLIKQK